MITITLENKEIAIKVDLFGNMPLFNSVINYLKSVRFRWDPDKKKWYGPAFKFNEVKEVLEEKDIVETSVTEDEIMEAVSGKPELEVEKVRRVPDFSLMNYPPMLGKHPNEDFQKDGIRRGINLSRFLFAWQQGTGKSYVESSLIAHRLYKYHDADKVLFVTSSIGVRNLKHEIIKFIKNLDENKILIGNKDCRNVFDDEFKDKDIIICSYNSFRLICDYYKKQFKVKSQKPRKPFLPLEHWLNGQEGMLILDESHEVSIVSSQKTFLMMLHAPLFKYRYLFTGTFASSPEKEFSQLNILDPWLVYNLTYTQWLEKHAILGNRFSRAAINSWRKDELEKTNKRLLKTYESQYDAEDVINLPDFYEIPIYIEMSPYHRNIYERITVEDLQNNIKNGKGNVRQFVNRFPYLMLSIDNPYLLENHKEKLSDDLNIILDHFRTDYMEKLHALDDIIETHKGEQILVWAIHPKTIEIIVERYKNLNPICITGQTPEQERNNLIEEFKTNNSHKILCANITTISTSVTLTEIKTQIYYELTFNYTEFAQSERRCYRIGQTQPVTTYILLYDRSVNVLQWKNLQDKGTLTKGLVSKDFLSQDQWQQIYNCTESTDFKGFDL